VFAEEREKKREKEKRKRRERKRRKEKEEMKKKEQRTYGTRSSAEDYWILLSKVSFIYLNN
jgi:hypothetical protein